MSVIERWTDDDGQEGVIHDGRLSVYGMPSMTRDDGTVAIGIDLPDTYRGVVGVLTAAHALANGVTLDVDRDGMLRLAAEFQAALNTWRGGQ